MKQPAESELEAALAQVLSALEAVNLDGLTRQERGLLIKAMKEARAALAEYWRAMRTGEPFADED